MSTDVERSPQRSTSDSSSFPSTWVDNVYGTKNKINYNEPELKNIFRNIQQFLK